MEPLGADQAIVEPGLEPVQQLPRQRLVGLRITAIVRGEAPRLVSGEYLQVRSCVAAA